MIHAQEFKVETVIHPVVAELDAPKLRPKFTEGIMAISSSSAEAAEHVRQGIARLNASWDFEGYRHFCTAAKMDPDCMMAYWGIAISLAGSQHEFFAQRQAAVERMLDLLEFRLKSAGDENKAVELERGYVEAAAKLLTQGVRASGLTFTAVSERFKEDVQSKLFSLFFQRDGFDEFGDPRPGQLRISKGLKELLKSHPDSISVLSFWVNSQSESPFVGPSARTEILPHAQKLASLHPDYPPFHLMLAHVEARLGNAALAIASCEKAIALFEAYMKAEKVTFHDCEGWIRAKVYLANLLATKGNYPEAIKVAKELAAVKIDKERLFSRGAGLLLWEGRTIGARLALGRSSKADLKAGTELLKKFSDEQWFPEQSFAYTYRDALAFCLATRVALSVKDFKSSKSIFTELLKRARAVESKRPLAEKTSTYGEWIRANQTLVVAVTELRGLLTQQETGALKLTAVNWFKSAIDRQSKPANLLPPPLDYPIQLRLGDYYMKAGDPVKAGIAYRDGLDARPNHLATLEAYLLALQKQGRKDDVIALKKRIDAVKK